MKIGNSTGISMLSLALMKNNRNPTINASIVSGTSDKQPKQSRPLMPVPDGWAPPVDPLSFRRLGEDRNLATGLSPEAIADRAFLSDPVNYANAFLHGRNGEESIGVQAMRQILGEKGVEIPDGARFDISVNSYGKVTITGLESEELTKRIEEAMSYDSRFIHSVLSVFIRSANVLEGIHVENTSVFTVEQARLMQVQSNVMGYGVHLHDLSLDESGRIKGLPQELYDKIYGDRSAWLSGMEKAEAEWENWNIDRIRDGVIHFLQNGTAHIPAPNVSLTFDGGRMIVNGVSGLNPNNGVGFNATI